MPKKPDDTLKTSSGKTYKSQIDASKKYDTENVYNVRLRVPKDWKPLIEEKAKQVDKSVNKFICDLIENEIEK